MTKTADEYASALFTLASESGCAQEIKDSLDIISEAFKSEPEYTLLMLSPAVSVRERIALLQGAFGGLVHEYALSCISLMCEHGEIEKYSEMADAYYKMLENFTKSATAYVTSAVPLSENEKERLRCKLSGAAGKEMRLEFNIDKTLIGGIKVETDGKILDGSIKSRLKRAKEVIDT